MKLTFEESACLALCLEGFLFGLYSGIFAVYLQYHASKTYTDWTTNILLYALCVLYVLSAAAIVIDVVSLTAATESTLYIADMIFGCCDFISQSMLIYRCWIVWGRNIHVVIIPSILAFAFLGTWLASQPIHISSGQISAAFGWENTMSLTSLILSMTVNALTTSLIVLRIFKVFQEIKSTFESGEQNFGATGGRKFWSIIFILIESGMALFSVQLARVVVTILVIQTGDNSAAYYAVFLIISIHEMLNGLTPTIILVRVSMGLSFHDEHSLAEATASLRFAHDHSNPIPETGSISIGHQESRHDGKVGKVRLSDEIQMVDR